MIMTDEAWTFIEDYPNYMISNKGRVLNIKRGRVMSCWGGRYLQVTLYKNGNKAAPLVHILVAKAFVPNPCGYEEVNHIDEVKTNNCHTNLEWCTAQYNSEYTNAKKWVFKNPYGDREEIYNLRAFCRKNNLNSAHMVNMLNPWSNRKSHKGWTRWIE
jgi:hypothetical protein